MTASHQEQNSNAGKQEQEIDKALEDTFPASDPVTGGGTTRIESEDGEKDEDLEEGSPE